jgi:hypothetical protein
MSSRSPGHQRLIESLPACDRWLPLVLALGVLLAACSSNGNDPKASGDLQDRSPAAQLPQRSPSIEGRTPDQHFESWLETGGAAEAYEPWLRGQLPGGGPPANATEGQLRTLFDEWVQDHLGLIRDAWNRAEDKGAQADLRLSLAIALTYFVEHESFAGFTPGEARTIEPSLTFNLEETVFGEVSIRQASEKAALFTTESASGAVFCAANLRKRDPTTLLGTVDAITVSECAGGWPE